MNTVILSFAVIWPSEIYTIFNKKHCQLQCFVLLIVQMKKLLALSAVAAVAGFMGLWYKNTRPKPVLPRDTVIAMLQRIDKESYMILCQMAACVSEIIKNAPIPPAPEQIQQVFKSPELGFPELFEQLYSSLYQDYQTSEDAFEYSIEHGYAQDTEIQFYRKRLAEDFHKAMLGTTPDIDRAIPISLGTDRVLEITQAILNQQYRIFQEGLKLIKEPVPIKMFKEASQEYLSKFKKQLYEKSRIHDFLDSSDYLLELAVANYLKKDKKFAQQYTAITKNYEQKMKQIIETNQNLFK